MVYKALGKSIVRYGLTVYAHASRYWLKLLNRLTKRISRSISYEALIQGDDKDLITRQREMQLVDKAVHLRCALRIIFQMPLKFAT